MYWQPSGYQPTPPYLLSHKPPLLNCEARWISVRTSPDGWVLCETLTLGLDLLELFFCSVSESESEEEEEEEEAEPSSEELLTMLLFSSDSLERKHRKHNEGLRLLWVLSLYLQPTWRPPQPEGSLFHTLKESQDHTAKLQH